MVPRKISASYVSHVATEKSTECGFLVKLYPNMSGPDNTSSQNSISLPAPLPLMPERLTQRAHHQPQSSVSNLDFYLQLMTAVAVI
jgi:hypothetical protein